MDIYHFSSLNDKEFEALAVDILSEHLKQRIERFKAGKDKGVDGRWFVTSNQEAILQCKHWIRSGCDNLIRHLKAKEIEKVRALKPARYILITSVELSRQNKQKIKKIFEPYIVSESDIFGNEDLHDLLAKCPDVEKRHYKLWLSSITVIGHIVNNAIFGRSKFATEEMQERISLYIRTTDHDKALEKLDGSGVLIITGEPGIGKTTLATQLTYECIANGYELVTIEENISEAEAIYQDDKKQVFYFDDFLGRNFLESLVKKYESHLVGFIKRICKDKTKRFILTSRTNILNQGKQLSELYFLESLDRREFELKITSLTRLEKAKILYNHLWHYSLPEEKTDEIYKDKRYKKIIVHRNFNPRLISFITNEDKVASIDSNKFWDYIQETLNNPQSIWDHFFRMQLNQNCRDIVYLTVYNGNVIDEKLLANAFNKISTKKADHPGKAADEYNSAIRIASGSVLNKNIDYKTQEVTYSLFNPSIADYIFNYVEDINALKFYFFILTTTSSLRTLSHMSSNKIISEETYAEVLGFLVNNSEQNSDPISEYNIMLSSLIVSLPKIPEKYYHFVSYYANNCNISEYMGKIEYLLDLLERCLLEDCFQIDEEKKMVKDPQGRIDELFEYIYEWPIDEGLVPILSRIVNTFGNEIIEKFRNKFKKYLVTFWKNAFYEYVNEADLLGDFRDLDEKQEAQWELEVKLQEKFAEFDLTLDPNEIEQICQEIDIEEIIIHNISIHNQTDESDWSKPFGEDRIEAEDLLIDDLFEKN